MAYLKGMPIAVLGSGAVGKTLAADCKLALKSDFVEARSITKSP